MRAFSMRWGHWRPPDSGLPEPSLAPGAPADLVLFRKPPLEAGPADVVIVMAEGQLRVLDPDLVGVLDIDGGFMTKWRGTWRWTSQETGL